MNILQLRQSQLQGLPFKLVGRLEVEGKEITKSVENRYVILPVPLEITGIPMEEAYSTLTYMTAAAGFTHLMLIYND